MSKTRVLILLIAFAFFVIGFSCSSERQSRRLLFGTFTSYWGDTFWSYTFDSSMHYTHQISGHFAHLTTKGNYVISDDTVYLKAFSKSQQPDSNLYFRNDTLIIHSDTCLLDKGLGYEYILNYPPGETFFESKRRDLNKIGRPITEKR